MEPQQVRHPAGSCWLDQVSRLIFASLRTLVMAALGSGCRFVNFCWC